MIQDPVAPFGIGEIPKICARWMLYRKTSFLEIISTGYA